MIEIDLDKISKNELTTILIEKDKEIERLKELCDKYEEEHKTTFETWQKDIKENKKLHSIIKEVREKTKEVLNESWYGGREKDIAREYLEILDKENK